MLSVKLENVKVSGMSFCIPETTVDLLESETIYGGNKRRLKILSDTAGFRFRRISDKDTTASDLCKTAAEDLLTTLNIDRGTIKHLIMITQYPQYLLPGDASFLHGDLGLSHDCSALSLNYGCSAYTYGLWLAAALAAQSHGRVLLLAGDTLTKIHAAAETQEIPIFGDGGSATILEYRAGAAPLFFDLGSDGSGAKTPADLLDLANGKYDG